MPSGRPLREDGQSHYEAWQALLRRDPCAYCGAGAAGTVDHVDFGIVADRDQMDDVWPLMEGIERALDDLHAAVVPRPRAGEPVRSADVVA